MNWRNWKSISCWINGKIMKKILLGGKKDEEALQERLSALEIRVEETARFLSEKAEELRLEEAAVEELQKQALFPQK